MEKMKERMVSEWEAAFVRILRGGELTKRLAYFFSSDMSAFYIN